MKLVVGADGQLAQELKATEPQGESVLYANKVQLDITNKKQVLDFVGDHKISTIINTAAYTKVDQAEVEKDMAFLVNSQGVENLALAAKKIHIPIIHVSTDYIFDGLKSSPYVPQDTPRPLNIYGQSKWEGEKHILAHCAKEGFIVRTSWVYSRYRANFVKTIVKLLNEKEELNVIYDQVGSPTWAKPLANVLWSLSQKKYPGQILHWTDAGVASWYDFAIAIQEEAHRLGLIHKIIPIRPIPATEYKVKATRPSYSVLSCLNTYKLLNQSPVHWRVHLREMLNELKEQSHE